MRSPADMKIIQIDITNACCKRCSNCTRFAGIITEPFFMELETFKQAVDSMKGFKGIVGIMGGEPTIHPQFEKVRRYYRGQYRLRRLLHACYEPTSDFVNHILANAYHTGFSNQRGLWTSVGTEVLRAFRTDSGHLRLPDDERPQQSQHAHHLMATRKELGVPDDRMVQAARQLLDAEPVERVDHAQGRVLLRGGRRHGCTLRGPGGWPIEPGWWKRTPADFGDQLHWCEMCSAALPMPARDARGEVDDVSPVWKEKLVQIESPKLKRAWPRNSTPRPTIRKRTT